MKVITPIQITNSTQLTSSTVAEPSAAAGEVEYLKRGGQLNFEWPIGQFDVTDEGVFYVKRLLENNTIRRHDRNGADMGTSFSVSAKIPTVAGVTILDGFIYVLGTNRKILKYNQDSSFTGVEFDAQPADGATPTCIGNDGFNLIVSYDPSGGWEKLTVQSITGAAVYPDFIDIGSNRNVTGICKSVNGIYMYDETSEILYELDSTVEFQDAGDTVTGRGHIFLGGLCTLNGLLYTSSQGNLVNQLYTNGVKAIGNPIGYRANRSALHKVYEAVAITQDAPERGVLKSPATWLEIGATSRFACFDDVIGTSTKNDSAITMVLTPGGIASGISGFKLVNVTSVRVQVTGGGNAYDETLTYGDVDINDWFQYLWGEAGFITAFALLDLPVTGSPTITVTFNGVDVEVGALIVGEVQQLGEANNKTNLQLLSFSSVNESIDGLIKVVKRPTAKLVNFGVGVMRDDVPRVYRALEALVDVNAVWIGTNRPTDATVVYGFHRDYKQGLETHAICEMSIQVRGLV